MDSPSASAGAGRAALDIPGVDDLEPIGRGGFGAVYRGRQAAFDRDVAVKVLSGVDAGSSESTWRREVGAMGRLSNHPNIVPVYDGGTTADGQPYLVMPFVPGGSLADVVRERGPLAPADVAALGAKLAGALASAHERGVLHRDVKPANVLLSQYGEPQLTDFGIARVDDVSTTTSTQALALTVAYAAPEVLEGAPATERSDVYSLAATLFMLLTGDPPFPAKEDQPLVVLAVRITTDPPPDLRHHGVPDALARVIDEGLRKDPEQRMADADELQRQLEAVATQLGADDDTVIMPVQGTPPPPPRTHAPAAPPAGEPLGTAPLPATVAEPPPRPVPSATPRRPYSGRPHRPRAPAGGGRGLVLAALALLVVAAGAALVMARGDGDGDGGDTTATSAAPEDPTAADDGSPAAAEPDELDDLAVTYLETLAAGDLDAAFEMLSPAMQASQPRASFDAFWGGLQSIAIVGEPRSHPGDRSVTVPVAFDGAREDYRLSFVEGEDGRWLVDGPRPG
jgi:serine/threonine-protein kinase PknK